MPNYFPRRTLEQFRSLAARYEAHAAASRANLTPDDCNKF